MFRGTTAVNLDSKGRLAIPTRYRAEILAENRGQMVCTIDLNQPCLLLFTLAEWEKVEQKLLALPNGNPKHRSIQRMLIGNALECELDGNGRILLSSHLRQHAKLEKSLMLVGQLNKFEIWSESAWQAQMAQDMAFATSEEFITSDEFKTLSF